MNIFNIIITTVLTTLAVLVVGAITAWALWPINAEAGAMGDFHQSTLETQQVSHCHRLENDHTKLVQAVVTATLDLDINQQNALQPVTEVVENWRAEALKTCQTLDLSSIDSSLASLQVILAQGSDAITEFRPAFDEFYASLDDNQRNQINEFIQSHHGRDRQHRSFSRRWHD